MISARRFRADEQPAEVDLAEATRLREDERSLVWVDASQPTPDDLEQLWDSVSLDPRALKVVRNVNARPTVRVYPDLYLVTVLSVESDAADEHHDAGLQFRAIELDMLVGHNLLVTIHRRPLLFEDELETRTATNPQIESFDADYLLYVLLDILLDHYAHELDKLQTRVNHVEERLLTEPGREALNEALVLKRQIHKIRRVVSPHREAFSSLSATDSPVRFRPGVEAEVFRVLHARLEGLVSQLDHVRDLALGSYSLYISNVSYRTNEQLKLLTILSAVLLPLSVVVGLFGTNFKLPEYEFLAPFFVMLIGIVVMACGMLAFFRWRRWL